MHNNLHLIFTLLEKSQEQDYIGEAISQLDHALQCANFAEAAGADEEMILAALLHDIGHLCADATAEVMPGLGVVEHESIGAKFILANGGSERIATLVEGHVQAKRYMVTTTPGYAERLSEASKGTLALQGGPMTWAEVEEFKRDPLFRDKLQIRVWDELGKEVGKKVPGLEHYQPMLKKYFKLDSLNSSVSL